MIDISIPPIYRTNKPDKKEKWIKNKTIKGKIVSVREARSRTNPTKQRNKDKPYSKAFIIIVDYETPINDLIDKRVEIKII